jgi:predicted DNA-binding protein
LAAAFTIFLLDFSVMAKSPFDFRAKLTEETRVWLEYKARKTGRDKQDIIREALHRIAIGDLHEAHDLATYAKEQGLTGADEGMAGQSGAGRK